MWGSICQLLKNLFPLLIYTYPNIHRHLKVFTHCPTSQITPQPPYYFFFFLHLPMASLNEANGPARKRNGELSLDQRSSIIYAYLNGCTTQTKLANDFGCTRKTIYNTIKRFQQHQTVESRPRTGRPRKYNDRTRKFIYLQARRNPFYTYKKLSTVIPGHPSRTTILTTLKAYGIRKYRTKLKIPIERSLSRRR
jgi:DNA-binding MarR family transcriptional regulator